MLSSIARTTLRQQPRLLALSSRAATKRAQPLRLESALAVTNHHIHASPTRYFSSPADPDIFKPSPPPAITTDMAEGIQDTTLFYLRNGVSNARLLELSMDEKSPLIRKWPRMMEIYLSTQVFVISGLGFKGDESGLQHYTQLLAKYIETCDDETKDSYKKVGQEIWRELLCTAFDLNRDEIKPLSIVDARNLMHKVCSKMQEPSILMKVQKECGKIPDGPDIEMEIAHKHQVLQTVILNDVYMGGSPSIPEEEGFGSGEKGYARMQCVMADFEGDPLISQYMGASTQRLWEAAGLDMNQLQEASSGNIRLPQTGGGTV